MLRSAYLHRTPSRETVHTAIASAAGLAKNAIISQLKFGKNVELDTQIFNAASRAADRVIPDFQLSKLHTGADLLEYLCKPEKIPIANGIPLIELYHGQEQPKNVTLINYRKKKWTPEIYRQVLSKAMRNARIFDSNSKKSIIDRLNL